MQRRSLLLGLVAAIGVAAGSVGAANADPIKVITDSGSAGSFKLTNLDGTNFKLEFTSQFLHSRLELANGDSVNAKAVFSSPIAFSTSGSSGHINLTSAIETKTFLSDPVNSPNPSTTLNYTLTSGEIGSGSNQNGLLLAGITTPTSPFLVDLNVYDNNGNVIGHNTYDFSGIVTISFALTGQRYFGSDGGELSPGAGSMSQVFSTTGASVTGSIGFAQAAVPEPASLAIVGVSLVGLLAYRRRGKRASAA